MLDLRAVFCTFPTLETERVYLRAISYDDVDTIFAIRSDARVMRYFGQLPMSTHEQAIEHVRRIQTSFQEQDGIRWAIASRQDGQFLGSAGFWRILKDHERAEIGYELAPQAWGQGIMVEALQAILDFGFSHMGLHSVEANIHPENRASRRVLEKLGFVQEGYFREAFLDPLEKCFTDTAVFSLLRSPS